ncbi:MAG: SMI1/KNR4 family protein [Clostridia bacterium]|nr:SMI1/KNR4 family protein [Clostridia bacterium]
MLKFKEQLEQKWGQFEKDEYFWKQRNIASVSPRTYLNVLFIPVDIRLYKSFEEEYNCVFPDELVEFYKHYNGIMLFCQSFRIFGFNLHVDMSYQTLHLNFENRRLNFQKKCTKYSNMISFGYYAEYNFCFDRKDKKNLRYQS